MCICLTTTSVGLHCISLEMEINITKMRFLICLLVILGCVASMDIERHHLIATDSESHLLLTI